MVEIECPHCEKDIQLDDGVFGLFECPHCEEEFAWNQENISDYESSPGEFITGLLAPFLITFFGLFIVSITLDGWDLLEWWIFIICLCPVWALGIGIYGHIEMRRSLLVGASISGAGSMTIILLFVFALQSFSWY